MLSPASLHGSNPVASWAGLLSINIMSLLFVLFTIDFASGVAILERFERLLCWVAVVLAGTCRLPTNDRKKPDDEQPPKEQHKKPSDTHPSM